MQAFFDNSGLTEADLISEHEPNDVHSRRKVLENELIGSSLPSTTRPVTPSPVRVLIVDDSIFCRQVIVQMLKRALEGGNVSLDYRENEDGIDAVNEVKSYEAGFDAIFMDNTMINCDGPQACRQIRALGYRNLIIGVTGNVLEDDVRYSFFHMSVLSSTSPNYTSETIESLIFSSVLTYLRTTRTLICM